MSIRKIAAVILACLTAAGTSLIHANAVDTPVLTECSSGDTRLLTVRRQIVKGWETLSPAVFFDRSLCLTAEELSRAVEDCRRENPAFFWVGNGYTYTFVMQNGIPCVTEYRPFVGGGNNAPYRTTSDGHDILIRQWETASAALLSGVDKRWPDEKRELVIHDRLLAQCRYTREGNFCATAYGAIVEGAANCEGYARAFQYLLQRLGIPCLYVEGQGNGRPHAWVMVYIDGKWLHTDPCWNDVGETPSYAYFNLSAKSIRLDHRLDLRRELSVDRRPAARSETAFAP